MHGPKPVSPCPLPALRRGPAPQARWKTAGQVALPAHQRNPTSPPQDQGHFPGKTRSCRTPGRRVRNRRRRRRPRPHPPVQAAPAAAGRSRARWPARGPAIRRARGCDRVERRQRPSCSTPQARASDFTPVKSLASAAARPHLWGPGRGAARAPAPRAACGAPPRTIVRSSHLGVVERRVAVLVAGVGVRAEREKQLGRRRRGAQRGVVQRRRLDHVARAQRRAVPRHLAAGGGDGCDKLCLGCELKIVAQAGRRQRSRGLAGGLAGARSHPCRVARGDCLPRLGSPRCAQRTPPCGEA
jgi:hypothetical protein